MKILGRMQAFIEGLADVDTATDVRAFVVDDALRDEIPGARAGLPEQLFVRQDDDGVEIALYVDTKVLERLENDSPMAKLHQGNLEPYCIALEGVSHFVYLIWRAQQKRPVRALELEIQAEVDKFIGAWFLLAKQGLSLAGAANLLLPKFFGAYVLHDDVPSAESGRYHTASRIARGFCKALADRHSGDGHLRGIKDSARTFYRQGLPEKLRAA